MLTHLVRAFFVIAVLAITLTFAVHPDILYKGEQYITIYILLPVVLAMALVVADMLWQRKRLQVLSGLFFGILAGLAIAFMLSLVVDMVTTILPGPAEVAHPGEAPLHPGEGGGEVLQRYLEANRSYQASLDSYHAFMRYTRTVELVKLLLGAASVFFCVTIVLQTKDEFRFVVPYVEFARQSKGVKQLLLDTSVIIDGRIADIAATRVLDSELVVPRFILTELQAVADSDDKLRRNRGRRGLDVLNRLQKADFVDIRILDTHAASVEEVREVDAKLVALAKHLDARVVTNDYNLNKIAQLRGVEVININDLANALKPVVLPGEALTVKVIRPGEEAGQGVGYLDDGTMVVAEQGRDHIGKEIVISVTSVLQTSAGRMIFGRVDGDKSFGRKSQQASTQGK